MRLAIGLAGAAVGNAILPGFGGQVGFALGTYAGGLLFGDDMDTKGPRIEDGKVTTSAYGQIIPVIYGVYPASGNIMDASEIREKKNKETGKGGGPSNTTYEYFGDLDVIVCEGIADAVLLIRANGEVIFDATPGADVVQKEWLEFEFYNGADDQPVDPTFEGLRGTDSTPNYGGTCHIVFKNFPYTEFGNQFAINFEFVVARNAVPQTVFQNTEVDPTATSVYGFGMAEPFTDLLIFPISETSSHINGVTAVDPYSRQVVWSYAPTSPTTARYWSATSVPRVVTNQSGQAYAIPGQIAVLGREDGVNDRIYEIDPETGGLIKVSGVVASSSFAAKFLVYDFHYQASATAFVMRDRGTFAGYDLLYGFDTFDLLDPPGVWFYQSYIATNGLGKILVSLQDELQLSTVFSCAVLDTITLTYSVSTPTLPGDILVAVWTVDSWWCICNLAGADIALVEIDDLGNLLTTVDVLADYGISDNWNLYRGDGIAYSEEQNSLFVQGNSALYEFHLTDLTEQPTQYSLVSNTLHATVYHKETGRIWYAPNNTNYATSANLYAKSGSGVDLSTVVNDLSLNGTRLVSADIDTVDLDSITVNGLGISQAMARRNVVSLLQLAYLFDYVPRDGVLTGLLRGRPSAATLTDDQIGAYVDGGTAVSPWTISRVASEQLPRQVEVTFSDPDHNYEGSTQHATRLQSSGGRTQRLNLPLSLTNDEGAQVADIYLHLANVEAETYETTTMPSTIDSVQPGNVLTVDYDGVEYLFRAVDASIIEGRIISLKGSREVPELFESYAVGGSPRQVDNTVKVLGATILWPMDIPALRSADDDAGSYLAATSYTPGWPGAVIYRSADGISFSELFSMTSPATMGMALNVPVSATGMFEQIQFNFDLRVNLISGALESKAYGDYNFAAWGVNGRFEIIAFSDVQSNADGSWTILNAYRGMLDSLHAIEAHGTSDQFIVLDEAFLARVVYPTSSIDQIEMLKAPTIGRPVNTGSVIPYNFTGESKTCFMPTLLSAQKDIGGTEDWVISWMRQDRIRTRPFWNPPMSEGVEEYQVNILRESGAVVRTVNVVGTNTYTYTLADQQADGWDTYEFLHFNVGQVSQITGVGHISTGLYGNYFGYSAAIISDGASNYYMLDDTAGTEAANELGGPEAYNAEYVGAYTLQQPPIRTDGNSVRFNSGYIFVDAKNVKDQEISSFEFFFSYDSTPGANGTGLVTFVGLQGSVNKSLSLKVTENNTLQLILVRVSGLTTLDLEGPAISNATPYQCIVNLAFNTTDPVDIWLNGSLYASAAQTHDDWGLSPEWYFGADMARNGANLYGYLDDISLYPDRLTQTQIDDHFFRGGLS